MFEKKRTALKFYVKNYDGFSAATAAARIIDVAYRNFPLSMLIFTSEMEKKTAFYYCQKANFRVVFQRILNREIVCII